MTTTAGGQIDVAAMQIDVESPIVGGIIDVSSGRLPADGTDEVLLHPRLATELGVGVGDTLTLARPDRTLAVVGLGRAAADHGRRVMLFGELDRDTVRSWNVTTLVDLPPDATAGEALTSIATSGVVSSDQIQNLSARTPNGYWYAEGFQIGNDGNTSSLAWGWVAGVLSLAALGVIIAAAFATSARRQLATVGQLAANGASPHLIRRTLSLQGTWSGAVGAAVGIGAAIVFFLVGTPLVERVVNHTLEQHHHRSARHGRAVRHRRRGSDHRRAAPRPEPGQHLGALSARRPPTDPPGAGAHGHGGGDLLRQRVVPARRCSGRHQRVGRQ